MNSKQETWINSRWRPMMGWMYFVVCIADFIVFPILWSILQAVQGGAVTQQWEPITLYGAGLFHVAMGAILGIAAWSRGQEKIAGVVNYQEDTEYQSSKYASSRRIPPEEYQPEI